VLSLLQRFMIGHQHVSQCKARWVHVKTPNGIYKVRTRPDAVKGGEVHRV
jgi:hypothetical protein